VLTPCIRHGNADAHPRSGSKWPETGESSRVSQGELFATTHSA
jgi:hypothetical protein